MTSEKDKTECVLRNVSSYFLTGRPIQAYAHKLHVVPFDVHFNYNDKYMRGLYAKRIKSQNEKMSYDQF